MDYSRSKAQAATFSPKTQLRATATQHAVLASDEFFHRVVTDVRQFAQRESFEDDVCLVGIEVRHTAASVGEEATR